MPSCARAVQALATGNFQAHLDMLKWCHGFLFKDQPSVLFTYQAGAPIVLARR
jgi:hypothetical protein